MKFHSILPDVRKGIKMMVNVPKCHQISSDEININKTLCHLNKNANISKKDTNNSKQDTYQYKLVL